MDSTMNDKKTLGGRPHAAVYGFGALLVIGIGALLMGIAAAPQLLWANLLVVSYYLLGAGLGAAVLLALCWVTGARWSAVVQPVVEKLTTLLPAGAIGVGTVLIGRPSLYPWTTVAATGHTASSFQVFWLERPFFLARALIYLTLWLTSTFSLVWASRRHDPRAARSQNVKMTRLAAGFLVVFALTCWLAGTDWIMSLEPRWSSTAFGVYQFSGMFLSAIAALIVLVIYCDRRGDLHGRLTRDHLHDLGTLLFAFSSFWMYIWFSQYLLIWYANIPEETDYFVLRQRQAWQPLFLANLVLNWGVPFVVLLFRPAKENRWTLLFVAVTVLVGRWVDLYLMVLPAVAGDEPVFGFGEAGLIAVVAALAALVLTRHPSVPISSLARP
jgi:hypothetical protein